VTYVVYCFVCAYAIQCNTENFYCRNIYTKGRNKIYKTVSWCSSFLEKNNTLNGQQILNKTFHNNEEVMTNMCSFTTNIRRYWSVINLEDSHHRKPVYQSCLIHTATKLLHLKPHKYTVEQKLHGPDCAYRLQFCIWLCEAVCRGEVDPLLTYFTDKTWF
jgi:hypothetical protein